MTDGVTARFSLATLLANDVGSNLSITAAGGASGSISLVTFNSSDSTVTVISAANASSTSAAVVAGSFTYTLSNGSTTTTGTVNVDVFNSTNGNDTLFGGSGKDSLTGGLGSDLFRYTTESDSPVDPDFTDARTGTDVIADFVAENDKITFGSVEGTASNYRESTVTGTDGNGGANLAQSGFISAADQAHGEGSPNGIRYFFGADTSMVSANGYLSFDNPASGQPNGNSTIDGNTVVVFAGLNTLAGFDFTNIV